MNRRNLIYILVGLILLVSSWQQRKNSDLETKVYAPTESRVDTSKSSPGIQKICYNNHCWFAEIANTNEDRKKGLMERVELGQQSGMLFVFPVVGAYPFWMKNTLIPLDMIWLNGSGVVVETASALPCLMTGGQANNCPLYGGRNIAKYVLELSSGMIEKHGIVTGSDLIFGY